MIPVFYLQYRLVKYASVKNFHGSIVAWFYNYMYVYMYTVNKKSLEPTKGIV